MKKKKPISKKKKPVAVPIPAPFIADHVGLDKFELEADEPLIIPAIPKGMWEKFCDFFTDEK